MIQRNELRFGSWVKNIFQSFPVQINSIDTTICKAGEYLQDYSQIEPIPLTLEILEKCGFIKDADFALLPIAENATLKIPILGKGESNTNEYEISFTSSTEVGIKKGAKFRTFGEYTVNGFYASPRIISLHQLQNIYFCLVGKELEVTL